MEQASSGARPKCAISECTFAASLPQNLRGRGHLPAGVVFLSIASNCFAGIIA